MTALGLRARARRAAANARDRPVRPATWLAAIANFGAWIYLTLMLLLGGWLVVVMVSTGWQPIVITGGSMQPTLRVGDVLLVEEHPVDLVGQRSVITFRSSDGDGLVTHRIREVLPEAQAYITKGDANPTPDTDLVRPADVVGIGRLVVPILGLPLVWAGTGNYAALAATLVVSCGAIVATAGSSLRSRRGRSPVTDRSSEMADRGIQRVRLLAGLMIAGQLYFSGNSDVPQWGPGRIELLALTVGTLVLVNVVSRAVRGGDGERAPTSLIVAELAADTIVAIALTALTGGRGIGWAFIALPIVEAAVRFRLAGALLHWIALTVVAVGARLWVLERVGAPLSTSISELEQLLDQFGVLLLVVIPGAYLTEQLVTDVLRQDRATTQAIERAQLLERVAETGYELSRLGSELFATMTRALTELGFDHAEAHLRLPSGDWRLLGSSDPSRNDALPAPGQPGSTLQPVDLETTEVIVDHRDPQLTEVLALQAHGLDAVVRLTVSSDEDRHVVIRAGSAAGNPPVGGCIDALRLLTGQAAVALQNNKLVTELQDVQIELEHQALHDALTGLPNRAQFLDRLRAGLADADDPQLRHAVMFMDLNGFKAVNDNLGHEAGDTLLVHVAQRLMATIGDRGLVARLGGDEFTVLLDPIDRPTAAIEVAHEIQEAMAAPFRLGSETVEVGGSVGIAFADPGLDDGEILRRADVAMYAAKTSGRNPRITTYHPSLDEDERRRGRLATEFKKALDREELRLVYQPLVSAAGGQIRGVEALLRWTHRELGPINTATILDLAELSERVESMMAWVFRRALLDVAGCRIPAGVEFTVAVNVSPSEFTSPRLIPIITEALATTGMPASSLVVELNERIITSGAASLANAERIVRLGVGLSLDDFGQGQTSLGHLRDLPISQLKLDRLLIGQAVEGETDRIILSSMIKLAHELHLTVVAEGIETADHQAIVTAAGADLLQGFGLYRPLELDQLRTVLAEQGLVATVVETESAPRPMPTHRPPPQHRGPLPAPVHRTRREGAS